MILHEKFINWRGTKIIYFCSSRSIESWIKPLFNYYYKKIDLDAVFSVQAKQIAFFMDRQLFLYLCKDQLSSCFKWRCRIINTSLNIMLDWLEGKSILVKKPKFLQPFGTHENCITPYGDLVNVFIPLWFLHAPLTFQTFVVYIFFFNGVLLLLFER